MMGRRKKNPKKISSITQEICENKIAEKSKLDEKEMKKREENLFIAETAIDIYSRLKLPLVYSMHHRPTDDSDEEEDTVELNFWPRLVFVSNLCLICMERSDEICESCGMVSYCSIKHKKQDRLKHRDLCKVLTEVCTIGGGLSLLSELTADDYRVYRLKLIDIVQCHLNRPLQLWEKEILLYPRVCCKCRCFSMTLKCCATCGIGLFCENHNDGHEECREFQVFCRMLFMQHENGYVDPELPDIFRKEPFHLSSNFDQLMVQLYSRSTYYCNMDCYTYCTLSHISTIPLTALYSMQVSCQSWETIDTFVIHIIGAEFQFECINLHVWEKLFLHLLSNLKYLKLMFVGPELHLPSSVPLDLLAAVKLCSFCKSSRRRINVSFHPGKLYHDFCHSKQFIKPHLICLFNPGLYRETGFEGKDTWPETIREFCKTKVPICVTSYTKQEIPQEMTRIKSIAEVETILEPQRNPFASIKPDRNFVSDDTAPLIYKNYYFAIVKGKS